MDTANRQLKEICKQSTNLIKILHKIKDYPDLYDDSCKQWEQQCLDTPNQIQKGVLKIAVAGAVKSGKSTFINALLGKDFLKRGAGVVTSVVTKIQKNDTLNAEIVIKSWDELNSDIEATLNSIGQEGCIEKRRFDLRRNKDRKCLKKIYETISVESSFKDNQVKPQVILIKNILNNYEFCKNFIQPDEFILKLKNDNFFDHNVFTGDPSKSFFVKDVKLEINFGNIGNNVQIADCQGIDSTDIAQLSQVLEYITSSNMIIYLISSRTGVREADIRFLSIINRMGLGNNVVYIMNCDLNEHESLDDLLSIEEKIQQDLLYFRQDLKLYSFSSLYNLFNQRKTELSAKNKKLLKVWQIDNNIIQHSNDMTGEFSAFFQEQININRQNLIFSNPCKRLKIIAHNLKKKVDLFSVIFSKDTSAAMASVKELKRTQVEIAKIQMLVKNSRKAILRDLMHNVDIQIDNYFSNNKDSVNNQIRCFIDDYVVNFKGLEKHIFTKNAPKVLYFIFQDFKEAFDFFLMEKVNPKLIKFVKDQEKALESKANSLYGSYRPDFFNLYNNLEDMNDEVLSLTDVATIKEMLGIRLPKSDLNTRYSAKIKFGSFTGLGIYSIILIFMKKVNRESQFVKTSLLKSASESFKKEVLRSIELQVNKYRYKIKKDYFYKLINAFSREINRIIIEQLQVYSVKIDALEAELNKEKSRGRKEKNFLEDIAKELDDVLERC